MKALVVGEWRSDIYEEAMKDAFAQLGFEVDGFSWIQYFQASNRLQLLFKKIQNKFIVGPELVKIQNDFLRKVKEFQPDIIFIFRSTHLTAKTIASVKKVSPKTVVFGFNNDDPFSKTSPKYLWRNYIQSLPHFDFSLAFRHHNVDEFKQAGAKRAELLRGWYTPKRNYIMPLNESEKKQYDCDIVFAGHFENDGRDKVIEAVVEAGYNIKVFGPEWEEIQKNSPILSKLPPIQPVLGLEYNKAINGCKIALCFLSKINRDTYTLRCFEVPATKKLLMSEYTKDLDSMLQEGVEADYFRDTDELLKKLNKYLQDHQLRSQVVESGYVRVMKDGHDVLARAKQVVKWWKEHANT